MTDQQRDALGRFAKAAPPLADGRNHPGDDVPRVSPTMRVGRGGTAIYGGFIVDVEKDKRLSGTEKYKTYSDILANVAIVAAGVRYFLNLVAKAEWKVEPPEDSGARGEELAESINDMMHDMETPWHRVVRRLAMFKLVGFAISEWTAKKREDGLIGMLDVNPRPQKTIERWITDEHSTVLGAVQRDPQSQREFVLPREKIIYLVDDSISDSPEGLGLFRHVVESAHRLRRYEQLEGFGYEGDLRGIPIGRAPLAELERMVKDGRMEKADADKLLTGLTDFIKNHVKNPALGILIDSTPYRGAGDNQAVAAGPNSRQWDVELMDGGSYSLAEVAAAIERVNREIARVLGVEQLLLGSDSRGSHALSKDKSQSFGLIVDSTLKELREQMRKDWLRPLFELNGWDQELMPKFKTETIVYRDIEQIAEVLDRLSGAGVQLDRQDDAVKELFDLMGLSRLLPLAEIDPDMALTNPTFGTPEERAAREAESARVATEGAVAVAQAKQGAEPRNSEGDPDEVPEGEEEQAEERRS